MSKSNVHEDYDQIAKWFDNHRSRELGEPKYLDLLINRKPNGTVLDLGCGMGEPIAAYLLGKKQDLIGVDGSSELLALAQKRMPQVKWVPSDMRTYSPDEKVAAVIAWHSLFHLSADDQSQLIPKISEWLLPGGVILFTSGVQRGEVWSENGGVNLFHGSLGEQEYRNLLAKCGFEVLVYQKEDPECGEATVWLCKKNNTSGG